MRRLATGLCIWTATALALCSMAGPAFGKRKQQTQQAQPQVQPQEQPAQQGGEAEPSGEPAQAPAGEPPAAEPPAESATVQEVQGASTPTEQVKSVKGERWKDIVVLPRRAVLKAKRVELMPMYHFSFNNPLIRHHAVGAQINYFLSEAMWLGIEGQYYFPQQSNASTGTYFLTGAQTKVLPAVNKLVFSTMLDFGYIPAQGKFALFNRRIMHWEGYVTAGVGVFMSQVIPVKPSDPSFSNLNVMFNVGFGTRLFLARWLALNAFVKFYGYPEVFEPVEKAGITRMSTTCQSYIGSAQPGTSEFEEGYASCRKDNGSTTLSQDVVFGLGVSIFLPPSFEYKLAR